MKKRGKAAARRAAGQDDPDGDLAGMSREALIAEVKALRRGIREHRDASLHELCWHHPGLWGLLPGNTDPLPVVPAWPRFLEGCVKYRESLDRQAPRAPRSDRPYAGEDRKEGRGGRA